MKANKDGTPFKGLGFWTRANAEICLLGTRGNPKRIAKNVGQALYGRRGRHSAKPPEVRERIMALVEGPYLELYARERHPRWLSWGAEID
jgi:N6-adenosine-specific RNA methylase IME4